MLKQLEVVDEITNGHSGFHGFWQDQQLHSMKGSDKASRDSITKVFKGEYGIHSDPRPAYKRCDEL